jgi:hypothetical protein
MFRTPLIAALTVALLGGTAMAQPANAPPANLSNSARSAPDYDDEDASPAPRPPDRGAPDGPPPPDNRGAYDNSQRNPGAQAQRRQAEADRDMFCRRDAAARTGYTTPREAARDEQTRGTVGGTLGGAALGGQCRPGRRGRRWRGPDRRHRHRRRQCPPCGARCRGRLCRCLLCLHA